MENIDKFAEELEEIILNHLHNGLTFDATDVAEEWGKLHPKISFKSIISKLAAQNKVRIAGKNTYEYRNTERID